MSQKMKWIIISSALVLTSLLTNVASAQTVQPPTPTPAEPRRIDEDRRVIREDKIVPGGNFTLKSNETLRGDLTVFGGDATLEAGSRVEGDLNLFGGSADVFGTITKDVSVIGGKVHLRDGSRVEGDINRVGGDVQQERGAYVGGSGTALGGEGSKDQPRVVPSIPNNVRPSFPSPMPNIVDRNNWNFNFDWGGFTKIIPGSIIITLLALLVAALIPRNITQAVEVARKDWKYSLGIGALTLFAGTLFLGFTLIFLITFCTNPLIWIAAVVIGWTVTSRIAGEKTMQMTNQSNWQPLSQIVIGSVVLAFLGAIPVVGDIFGFLFVALGLGAFVLSRGGTQSYPLRPTAVVPTSPSVNQPATSDEFNQSI
jgi:hypothetical protein